jgi:3',5'-cyclic AMP phosphodiesterase CpdA
VSRAITRREALAEALLAVGGGAVLLSGCGGSGGGFRPATASGSTLLSTWGDPVGDGHLRVLPGEPLLARSELGAPAAPVAVLATIAHVTDAHVLDAESPARVTFLDRLGAPFTSTFRPHETLTTQVLAGALRSVRVWGPHAVIQGGDLIDNAQSNELEQALAGLGGGVVRPGSGPGAYRGVQSASNPDPFYYRPDVDAPRHAGLLRASRRAFVGGGVGRRPWYPVLGDHDILVAGVITPTPTTRQLAVGDRALWELPRGLRRPPLSAVDAGGSPDGPPDPGVVDTFLAQALAGPTVRVPADPARRELDATEVVDRLRVSSTLAPATGSGRLDYSFDLGPRLRLIVLDLARRGGGSGGLVQPDQPAWLERQLTAAGERWVIVVSHQPLGSSVGGSELLALLDGHPRVVAALSGHTHRNRVVPRAGTGGGGYWEISTASLIDYPQQSRALRVLATADGGVAIETWMLDHVGGRELGRIARQLAYLDAQGGRPKRFAGARPDRNVRLYRRAV